MLNQIKGRISDFFRYSGAGEYSRRYAVMNAFDGAVAILGIILGSALLGGGDPRQVAAAGVGALVAMGISGASGTYMAESAEQERRIREIEEAMLIKLDGSVVAEARRRSAMVSALVDAAAAIGAGMIVLSPYLAASVLLMSPDAALYASLALALAILFTLGIFLGRVSRGNILSSGLKALAIGLATILAITLLDLFL